MNDNFFKFWVIVAGLFCLAVFLNFAADMFGFQSSIDFQCIGH